MSSPRVFGIAGRRAAAGAVAAALVVPAGASAADPCPGADVVVGPQGPGALVEPTLCLLNGERAAAGRHAVSKRAELGIAAARFSAEMVSGAFFAHRAPGGPDLVGRLTSAGYLSARTTRWVVGENLAWARGSAATPRNIVAQWMASPGHRHNVLEPAFREIGLGVVAGSPGDPANGVTLTTDFGVRATSSHRWRKARRDRRSRRRWALSGRTASAPRAARLVITAAVAGKA